MTGVPWFTDKAGVRWYTGECGGCGHRYPSQDWNTAANGACPQHGGIPSGPAGDGDLFAPAGSLYTPATSDAAW